MNEYYTNFDPQRAETLALMAVGFILNDEKLQQGFMALSGVAPDDLKVSIQDPGFLGGVLDFLLSDEDQLIEFCRINELDPMEPAQARQALPGATPDY